MADQKVTALVALASATTDDILYIVDDPTGTPASKKITFDNLQKSINTLQGPAIDSAILTNSRVDDYQIFISTASGPTPSAGTVVNYNSTSDERPHYVKSTGVDLALASLTGTETLTNKTLTSPKINENVALTSSATELNLLDGITVLSGSNTGDNVEVTSQAVGFTITKGTTPKTLTVALDATVSGNNTGDQTSVSGNAGTVTVADAGGDTTTFPLLATDATGNLSPCTDAGITYNATTNILTAGGFAGPLTGNVTGNVTGSSGSTTGNAATVTTNANLTGVITSSGNATSIASQTGTGTKFVVDTSPTLVTPNIGVATGTSIAISQGTVISATFTNTAASGSGAGSGMIGYSDDGAALASGDRLGFFILGGARDASHTLANAAGIAAFTGQAWSGSATGAYITFETMTNSTTTRTEKMRLTDSGNLGLGTSAFGTSASGGVISLTNGCTIPTTSPADVVQVWAKDTVAGQANLYARNENGKVEQITGLVDRVSTQLDKTDTTLTAITGLSINVEAAKSYAFKAVLFYDASVIGGQKYSMYGTATATAFIMQVNSLSNATNAFVITSRQTSLDTTTGVGQAGSTAGITTLEGVITVNGAGTLTPMFAQNAANATSSILVGSYFEVIPIGD